MPSVPTLRDHSRAELAVLLREYLLCGHLIDRAGMGYLIGPFGREGMVDIAIDEWAGASPIYTQRIQRLLGFEGDDIPTIFKGLQFDVGAPHEFMDFRYTIHDATHGEFRLDHCGALMDVEPMGEDFVVGMCHTIEDPTFDATACATNPRARMRPIHRPPRTPADRHPHCAWTVTIEDDAEALAEAATTLRMRATKAAGVPLATVERFAGEEGEGWDDYTGEFVDRLPTEAFSKGALLALVDEVCLQYHLLSTAFAFAVSDRDAAKATEILDHQFTGIAGLTAERLAAALGLGHSLGDLACLLGAHPALRPAAYIDVRVSLAGDGSCLRLDLFDSPALHENEGTVTWVTLLRDGRTRALEAIVHAIDPRVVVEPVEVAAGAVCSWDVTIGEVPAPEQPEVGATRISTGAAWEFEPPRDVKVALTR